MAHELDVDQDVVRRADIEIVQGRYVGVRLVEFGAVGQAVSARVYDGSGSKLLHTTAECDQYSVGDDIGPTTSCSCATAGRRSAATGC